MAIYLVTGGCGFIGSHLCERLLRLGHQVRVLDNLSTGHRENLPVSTDGANAIELIVGDVADPDCVTDCMAGVNGCFHLAAIASVQRSTQDWLGTHRSNLTGTITIFNAARRAGGARIPVIYASSAAVYGDNQMTPLRELSAVRPITAYGADKLGGELHALVATLVHEVPTCGFRFFNVFGPRQDPHSSYSGVISIFVDRLTSSRPLSIYGDGRQQRDFVYVGDVVDHLVAALDRNFDRSRIFNVCRGQGTTILDLASTLGKILGVRPTLHFEPAKTGDIYKSIGDPTLSITDLYCRAATTLPQGLQHTVDYMRLARAA